MRESTKAEIGAALAKLPPAPYWMTLEYEEAQDLKRHEAAIARMRKAKGL